MIFLGIDQTGAVDRLGHPKPLPACLIEETKIKLFYIDKFSGETIKKFSPDLVCIDCVLGLPTSTGIALREALKLAAKTKNYGRAQAQSFFSDLAHGKKHTRHVETALNANSVFTVHPFQKNIQTGTFRFWKEMGLEQDWFYFPALPREKAGAQKIPIVEGYPSYYWKLLLKQKNRQPLKILEILKVTYPKLKITEAHKKLLIKDSNLADALVLALAAQKFKNDIHRKKSPEGWILGFTS